MPIDALPPSSAIIQVGRLPPPARAPIPPGGSLQLGRSPAMSRSAPARPRVPRLVAAAVAVIVVPLGVIALGIGSASAAATVYEAESATLSQATVATNHPGFTGTGFADYNAVAGSYVEWTVGAANAGTFSVTIRYANGSTGNRPLTIAVNGANQRANLAFNTTGSWNTWQTVTTTLTLAAGSNKIRATATDAAGGPNLDNLSADTGGGDTIPPTVPANPRTSNLTCNSVDFAWDASTDNVAVTNYDIFHDGQLIKSVGGSTTSTSLTVVPGVPWGLYVQARDAAGNVSQASDTVNITPPACGSDTQPPTNPTNLTGSANNTNVSLKWTASTDNVQVIAYDIFRDGAQVGSVTGVVGTPPGTSFTDGGLAANTTFQ